MNNIIYDPNFIPGQPVYIKTSEDRLIPFLGGAIIGGLGGAAIANNQGYYGGGYYPYYQPVYYYPYSFSENGFIPQDPFASSFTVMLYTDRYTSLQFAPLSLHNHTVYSDVDSL